MKTYIEQVAEAVRDATINSWCNDKSTFPIPKVTNDQLREIIASVPTPEPAAEINRQLLDVETKRFLTDVITAAGLLYYGKTDKRLSSRINEHAAMLLTATAAEQQSQPEPVNKQLLDAAREFCARVEAGEVRSKYTYSKFKEAIAAAEMELK